MPGVQDRAVRAAHQIRPGGPGHEGSPMGTPLPMSHRITAATGSYDVQNGVPHPSGPGGSRLGRRARES